MSGATFQRYEKKYRITADQYLTLQDQLANRMIPDRYGRYTISNLYYDTDRFDLIRMSIEKPVYKEKLRLRSYGTPGPENPAYLELKKKYDGVVYKRRAKLPYETARDFLAGYAYEGQETQILKEIRYFLSLYDVEPKVFLAYDRVAWAGTEENPGLRVTFDANIRFRQTELSLRRGTWGTSLLEQGAYLMEVKVLDAFPIWLSRLLSEVGAFPSSFSKYGTCYMNHIADIVPAKEDVHSA